MLIFNSLHANKIAYKIIFFSPTTDDRNMSIEFMFESRIIVEASIPDHDPLNNL